MQKNTTLVHSAGFEIINSYHTTYTEGRRRGQNMGNEWSASISKTMASSEWKSGRRQKVVVGYYCIGPALRKFVKAHATHAASQAHELPDDNVEMLVSISCVCSRGHCLFLHWAFEDNVGRQMSCRPDV